MSSAGAVAGTKRERDAQALLLLLLRAMDSLHLHESGLSEAALTATARALFLLRVLLSGRGVSFTERDLYYTNPALFGSQGQRAVHRSLERLCTLMDAGVAASSPCLAAAHSDSKVQARAGPAGGCSNTGVLALLFTKPRKALLEMQRLASCPLRADGPAAHCCSSGIAPLRYTRGTLCVTAAPRSVLVGPLTFTCHGRSVSVGQRGDDGWLVSDDVARASTAFAWEEAGHREAIERGGSGGHPVSPVLVFVEKESTLRTLRGGLSKAPPSPVPLAQRFFFLCTRGYPCVASRHLLRRLHAEWPTLPMVALVDGDPHGMQILLTLMAPHSSSAPQQEKQSTTPAPATHLPIRWLGVKPSSVAGRSNSSTPGRTATMALTERDAALVRGLRSRLTNLMEEAQASPSADASHVWQTAQAMLAEVTWMGTARQKCELQAADPLNILLTSSGALP